MPARYLKLPTLIPDLPEQPSVFDGDGALVGKSGKEGDLGVGDPPGGLPQHRKTSDDPPLPDHRDRQNSAKPLPLSYLSEGIVRIV